MGNRSLIICGNARSIAPEELIGSETWGLKTGSVPNLDMYWDFHGIPFTGVVHNIEEIPIEKLHKEGLPLMNSICILLAHAIYSGNYSMIQLKGCPLRDKTEYIRQKPALAFLVGLAKGRGIKIHWEQSGLDFIHIYMDGKV